MFDFDGRVFFPTLYRSDVNYTVRTVNSAAATETIFDAKTIIDLSNIFAQLTGSCNIAELELEDRILNISNDGILDINQKTIVWQDSLLIPGESHNYGYTVEFSGCSLDGLEFDTTVTLSGNNISPLDANNTIRLSTDFDDHEVLLEKKGNTSIYENDITTYAISIHNAGFSRLDKIVVFDQIPWNTEFVSILESVDPSVKIFVHTGGKYNDYDDPPAYNYTTALSGDFGSGWLSDLNAT